MRGVVAQQALPDDQQPARREHRGEDRQADDERALGRAGGRVAVPRGRNTCGGRYPASTDGGASAAAAV